MLTLDGLVMITVDDEDWRVDRLELRITPIWLLGPHLSDLVDEAVETTGPSNLSRDFQQLLGDRWSERPHGRRNWLTAGGVSSGEDDFFFGPDNALHPCR